MQRALLFVAATPAARTPSALVLFLRNNWRWLVVVVVVAVFVMMVASD